MSGRQPEPATIESAPVYAQVARRIRDDVTAGIWPLGGRLTMADLQRRYGVSPVPIREALQELRGEGLVEIHGHRGARVPLVDPDFVAECYDVRAGIRSVLARRCAERVTERDLRDLALIQRDFESAARRRDVPALLEANRRFHTLLDGVAGNRQALALLRRGPTSLIDAARLHHGYGPARLAQVVKEHRALIEAMAARDGERAARLVFEHAMGAKADLLAQMAKRAAA
jgi:DNA-binding GntR family transcriptional regulator